MPYDEDLDARIADAVTPLGATRKKMFGGTGYLLDGNMLAGVHKDHLVLRLGEDAGAATLEEPGVRPFDITGRPMAGWVMVDSSVVDDAALERWLALALDHVRTLPPK